ncbi:ABC transporter ATP-binding protein [Candidatus Atribacteria bacterium 1244-E10-H5-B2]|nr:MAG: ABC transporter ATP-binding protein [Candidatus Atribacteria bacterium 1244-E10-H5-B2]
MQKSNIIFQIREVSKSFGGVKAVNQVSFQAQEKEIIGLIGPNGAGKTTLFNLITGFLRPDEGHIYFRDRDITNLKPHRICQLGIGRTFQVVRPLSTLTVLENIVTAALLRHNNCKDAEEYAINISQIMGLASKISKIAGGIPIADKKRLGFAQALATGAKLLLLDEVAAGLNSTEVDEFLNIIRKVSLEGLTIIMVEHVMKAVMNVADRILVLDHGGLIAQGRPEEVTKNEEVIKAYLGDQYKFQKSK